MNDHKGSPSIWGHAFALDFMLFDSRILVDTLLRVARQGIAALPMHGVVMVSALKESLAREVMEAVAERMMGSKVPAVKKECTQRECGGSAGNA